MPEQRLFRCRTCGTQYPATLEFFCKASSRKFGITTQCKSCILERRRVRRLTNDFREKRNKYQNAYRVQKPYENKISVHKAHARSLGLSATFTVGEWEYALDYFHGRCAVCGRLPDFWHVLAVDHWIPIDDPDCPGFVRGNIVPLCHSTKGVAEGDSGCNNAKKCHDPARWLLKKLGPKLGHEKLMEIETYFASLTD